MGIETLRRKYFRKMKIYKKGPFGIFIKKLCHKKEPENEVYNKIQDLIISRSQRYNEMASCRFWDFFKNYPVYQRGVLKYKRFMKNEIHFYGSKFFSTDAILNYFLYRTLPDEEKEKLTQIYEQRYDVKINPDFSKDFVKPSHVNCVRKSDFVLWMNYYLENNVSEDFLELDSFEIALKLGQIWNDLPYREREAWFNLSLELRGAKEGKTRNNKNRKYLE